MPRFQFSCFRVRLQGLQLFAPAVIESHDEQAHACESPEQLPTFTSRKSSFTQSAARSCIDFDFDKGAVGGRLLNPVVALLKHRPRWSPTRQLASRCLPSRCLLARPSTLSSPSPHRPAFQVRYLEPDLPQCCPAAPYYTAQPFKRPSAQSATPPTRRQHADPWSYVQLRHNSTANFPSSYQFLPYLYMTSTPLLPRDLNAAAMLRSQLAVRRLGRAHIRGRRLPCALHRF